MSPTDPPVTDTPATGPWKLTEPSAHVIQQHYVNARVNELNSTFGERYRQETIEALLQDFAAEIKGQSKAKKLAYCEGVYNVLTKTLQGRDLTINFKAVSWFSQENGYETYSQMYERAIDKKTGKMFLTDSDKLNPASTRATADDRITFPQHWAQSSQPRRGLAPGNQPTNAIVSKMMTGAKIPAYGPISDKYLQKVVIQDKDGNDVDAYESKNKRFNPKTKQVFTALNYGRRVHGSSTQYGQSYLVMNPNLKVDAIYFAGDTFFVPGADFQVTYQSLGALYLKAKPDLRQLLIKSCVSAMKLEDTSKAQELVEAHIFSQVRFASDITAMYLEPSDATVTANAQKFCRKWGIQQHDLP